MGSAGEGLPSSFQSMQSPPAQVAAAAVHQLSSSAERSAPGATSEEIRGTLLSKCFIHSFISLLSTNVITHSLLHKTRSILYTLRL